MESRNGFSTILVLALALFMLVAFYLMRSAMLTMGGMGAQPSVSSSLFRVVNAATLTGFQSTTAIDEYKPLGQAVFFALMVAGTLVSLIVGGIALARALDMPFGAMQITVATLLIYTAAVMLGALAMMLDHVSRWPAIFQAASAFGNCGLVLGPVADSSSWHTHLVLLPLAVLGGLSIPILLDLFSSLNPASPMHAHTKQVLTLTAAIYLAGMILVGGVEVLALLDTRAEQETTQPFMSDAAPVFLNASTEVLNSRTLGMPFGSFQNLSIPSQWIILLLMLIGASPASAGGGIKATTLYVFVRDSICTLRGRATGRIFGLASVWIASYAAVIAITTVLLIHSAPQTPADRMLFLAVSAVGTVGTSHSPLSLTDMGAYVLSAAMLFGRFAPLLILMWAGEHLNQGRTIR